MIKDEQTKLTDFYFALPRLLNRRRGGTDGDFGGRATEAYLGSGAIFVVTYLASWHLIAEDLAGWPMVITATLLVFAVWIFWLVIFFLNSLIVKTLRMLGFFRQAPGRAVQDILIALTLTVLAMQLSIQSNSTRWVGILFLVALAANLVAAAILRLKRWRV